MDPWPPSRGVLDANAFFFKHGLSLSRYLSHIRSALRLLEAPVNVLAETAGMIRGAIKFSTGGIRFKPRADAEQTRALVNCAKKDFGRSGHRGLLDSCTPLLFAIWCGSCAHADGGKSLSGARRGGEECAPSGYVDSVPSKNTTVTVVRRCICKLQGRTLCGACVLKTRVGNIRLFPHVWYTEGLAYLKAAANASET